MGNERFHISHFMLHMVFNFYQSSHIFQRRTLVYTVCDSDNSSSKSFFKRTLKDSTSTFFTHAIKTQTEGAGFQEMRLHSDSNKKNTNSLQLTNSSLCVKLQSFISFGH